MFRILVLGADGQLGKELKASQTAYPQFNFIWTDISQLDITDIVSVRDMTELHMPDYIINCAGYTDVDQAEEEAEISFRVNGHAVGNIINEISETDIHFIQISTDYIFNGDSKLPYQEDHPASPLSVYGRSKLMGEEYASSYNNSLIIRTSWLYSSYGHNFVKTIMRLGKEKDEINVVDDQIGAPTWTADLVKVILEIIIRISNAKSDHIPKVLNYSNTGQCTWYEFALAIKKYAGLSIKINPVPTAAYPLPAGRPGFSVLDKTRIINNLDIDIPHWEESLQKCIMEIIEKENGR